MALAMPGAEEAPGKFAFEVRNTGKLKGFVWVWMERVVPKKPRVPQPNVVAIRVANLADKDFLLGLDADKFFTEPHYDGFPAVLVRLNAVTARELKPLIAEAWRCQAPKELLPKETPPRRSGRRISRLSPLLVAGAFAGAVPLAAQSPAPRDAAVTIGTAHRLHSSALGEDRPYLVYEPPGTRSGPLPVIVLLDGDAHFHHVTGAVRFLIDQGRMPSVRVIAVPNTTDRTRDLTPAAIRDSALRAASPTAGGADRMLRFLADELLPEVERRYGAAPFRVLVGHSFGGLFALNALLNRPGVFQAFIAISPSLWWDRERLTDSLVARLAREPRPRGWLYATVGALEDLGENPRMIAPFRRVERLLREQAPASLEWRLTVLDDEDHGSTPHRSTYDGLETIFRPFRVPPDSIVALGVAGLDRRYAEARERFGFPARTPEAALNTLGYLLLADPRPDRRAQATSAFRENARRFPRSANVYDSMGDLFRSLGQKDAALACFAASVRTARAFPDEGDILPGSAIAPGSLDKMAEVARELGRPVWTAEAIPEQVTAECLAGQGR